MEAEVSHLKSLTMNEHKATEIEETDQIPKASELQARILELENKLFEQDKAFDSKYNQKEEQITRILVELNEVKIRADPGDLSKLAVLV